MNNTQRVWDYVLKDLSWQMTKVTFERWLSGSKLLHLQEGQATVQVRDSYAVDWCAKRLIIPIRRTLAGAIGASEVSVTFCTGLDPPQRQTS
jgi:hypothetical protein